VTTAETLAGLIRREIEWAGLSQAEVCRAVGLSPKHLSQFLGGRNGMSLDLVDAVLATCDRRLVLATVPVEVGVPGEMAPPEPVA
jgi:transcriptional regulator with XRE-family HTH domain